ncbi:MAG: prepilin-type N-terminal cleavage/methylation domain-containing protein [bacterium]|nr:prepilin-type N-terminal cleavage/methylation domain-containing protein [bacterium]
MKCPTRGLERTARRAGFTLVEIIVTIAIVGLMLASVTQILTTVRMSRDSIHNIQEVQLAGPAIMDLIERDMRGLVTTNVPTANHLRVVNRVLLGEDADRVDFLSETDSLIPNLEYEFPMRADVNEVGYCLRINPEDDRFLEMYRRESFGVDEESFTGGVYTFLHDRVRSFDIEIYENDGPEEEPIDEWGMDSTDPETQGLPASLKITLILELSPRLLREQLAIARVDKQIVTYSRVVRLPEAMRVAEDQIPRLNVPVPPDDSGDPIGGGGDDPEGAADGGGLGNGGDGRGQGGDGAGRGQGGNDGSLDVPKSTTIGG